MTLKASMERHRYLSAILAVAVMIPPGFPLFHLFNNRFPLQYFLVAVAFAAWNGGFGPGVLATVAGAVSGLFLFLPGRGQGVPTDFFDVARLVIYLAIGFTISILSQALRRLNQELVQANAVKGRLLANISHELRTPLAAMIGFADLARDAAKDEADRIASLSVIKRNGQRLTSLVDDLLTLSAGRPDPLEIHRRPVDLRALLEDVVAEFHDRARDDGSTVSVDADASVPEQCKTDPDVLARVLRSLVDNALKFGRGGKVVLRVRARGGNLEFEVEDAGVGIEEKCQGQIFDVLYQADASLTRRHGGAGIGLTLARQLARLLGGDVRLLRSRVGEGSVFQVWVPG